MVPAPFSPPNDANKFCSLHNLHNESDVEQFFVLPLLIDLGYGPEYISTKSTIREVPIGKGHSRKSYAPDYLVFARRGKDKPSLLIDAKHPNDSVDEGVLDAQMYASVVRRRMAMPKPEQLCIGVNGHWLKVKHYDSDEVLFELPFKDFRDGNPDFFRLKTLLGRDALRTALEQQPSQSEPWRPIDPSKEQIKAAFQQCHNRIWKRESLFPTAAFYEFTKLVFLKLREDERLHSIMDSGKVVELKDLHFHTEWIDNTSEVSPNPINSILFRQLVQDLEEQVRKNRKNRFLTQRNR